MMSLAYEPRNRGRAALSVVFLLVLVSLANTGRAETRYVYQTRYTKYVPHVPQFVHAAVKLGDGWVGLFGAFGSNTPELFDPATEKFLQVPGAHSFGGISGVALPDGRALLTGVERSSVFDFQTRQFIDLSDPYSVAWVSFVVLVPLPDGQVFICGGWDKDSEPLDACALFDPRTLQFRAAGRLQVPRADHTAVALDDHHVLVAGGYGHGTDPSQPEALDTLEIFDIQTGLSRLLPVRLHRARYGHSCVVLPDRRVLIFGGTYWGLDYFLPSTEIFDPNSGTLTPTFNLGLGRTRAEVAVLPSGRIAVFGGNYDARAVELYCPATGTWALADRLTLDPRWSEFSATVLDSGAVLLVGGRVNDTIEIVPNAEIFTEVAQEVNVPAALDEPMEEWCVELWDGDTWQSTVWLRGYDCPEYRSVAYPHQHFLSILRATEEVSFTRLVVRFSRWAPYDARVKLFNLAGWTRVPEVVLGPDLDVRPPEDVPLP
jgi:hypothetical protein